MAQVVDSGEDESNHRDTEREMMNIYQDYHNQRDESLLSEKEKVLESSHKELQEKLA